MKSISEKALSEVSTLLARGYELDRLGHFEEADKYYRYSIDSLENTFADEGSAGHLNILAAYAFHHGTALEELGKLEHAASAYKRAIEIWDAVREDGCSSDLIVSLARALTSLGRVKRKSRNYRTALDSYERARGLLLSILMFTHAADPRREILLKVLSGTLLGAFKSAAALRKREQARGYRRELKRILGQ